MSLRFFYDAENSNNLSGTDYSSGDTTGSNANTTFLGAAGKTGAYGLTQAANTAGSITFTATNITPNAAQPNISVGAMSCWFKWLTGSLANGSVVAMRTYGANTADRLAFEGISTGGMLFKCANGSTSAAVSANIAQGTLSAATWYYMIGRWDIPGGKLKIEMYTDAGNNSLSLVSANEISAALSTTYCISSAFTVINVGVHSSAEGDVFYTDHFMMADTYDAPLQENAFITNANNYSESVTFTSAPTVSSQSDTAYTVGFTPSMTGTMYGVATIAGSTTPSMAQIKAGQNGSGTTAKASVTKAVPVGANTVILTPSDTPAFPRYDLHFVFSSATSNSSIVSLTGQYLDAPTGKIFATIGTLDTTSPFYGTGVATNDTVVLEAVTSPDNYDISCVSDGTVSFTANGDSARQLIAADAYDYSAGQYMGAGTLIFNNLTPTIGANNLNILLIQRNIALAPIPLNDYAYDAEGDIITATAQNTLPTGLSVSSSDLIGTPTVYGQTNTTIQWADQYGATFSNTITIQVGDLVPDVVGDPQATAVSTITGVASLTANVTLVSNPNVANGTVISTDPVAATLVRHNSAVEVYVANGSSISITTTSLSSAIRNNYYSAQLTASGVVTSWSLESGTLPTGLSLNPTSGIISGTPTTLGSYNFTVGCTNGVQSDTKALSIGVTSGVLGYIQIRAVPTPDGVITTKFKNGNNPNGTPSIRNAPPLLSYTEGVGGSYNFGQHGSDPDGNPVTYSLQGTQYTGISIDSPTGILAVGTDAVAAIRNLRIRITDSGALYSEVNCQVTIASTNLPPSFTNAPDVLGFTETVGGSYNFGQHGSDPDGNPVTYSLQGTQYTGISMNTATGILTVSTSAVAATRELTIRITDSGGLFSEHVCVVTITAIPPPPPNDAPIFTNAPPVLSYVQGVGGSYNFGQHGSDPNFDAVTYTLQGTSYTGITIANTTGILTVSASATAATRTLTVRITDTGGLYSEHVCVVTITVAPPPPTEAHFIIPSNVSLFNCDVSQPLADGTGSKAPNSVPGCIIELSAGTSTRTATAGTRGPLEIRNPIGTSGSNPTIIRNPLAGNVTLSGSVDFIFLITAPQNTLLDGSNGGQTYGIKSEFTTPGVHTLKIKGMWANVHIRNIECDGNATTYTGPGGIGFNPNDQSTVWGRGVFKSNLIIESCYIHHFKGEGMYIGSNYSDYEPPIKNITVRNNIVEYCGRDGINGKNWWEGVNSIYGNKVTNVGLNNPEQTGQLPGITITGGTGDIYNNYLENIGEHGIVVACNEGPPFNVKFGPATDLQPANGGVYSYGPYTTFITRIYNNLCANTGKATWTGIIGNGIQLSGDAGTVLPTAYVYNNTCVNCRGYGIALTSVYGGWMRNNVLINNTRGTYYLTSPGTQANNKVSGTLTSAYKLTAEDAAGGTLGTDIAYTDLNSSNPALPGVSRSGTASKGAFEFATTTTRVGIYNTVDFETGSIKSQGTNPDGLYVKAMKDSGYVNWQSYEAGLQGLGPATTYQPTNAGLTTSGTYDVAVKTSFTYPATPNGSSGTVNPRTGNYMLGSTIYKTKDYCGLNGAAGPNDGNYTDGTALLDKPRNFAAAQGTGQRWAWNDEVWIGYSIYLPPNFETDLGKNGSVRGNGAILALQSIFGFEQQDNGSMAVLAILAPWNFGSLPNSNTASWHVSGATGTGVTEGSGVYSYYNLGEITNDIGKWTDFVWRIKINPYTVNTTIYGKTFVGNTGIMQVWKSTGSTVDGNGNRTMTRVLNKYNTPVGLAMNSSADMVMMSSPRMYKYGWKKPDNNSTVTGPIFIGWDAIRFGRMADGAGFSDVHATLMANPNP
jgi:hypothetical protein